MFDSEFSVAHGAAFWLGAQRGVRARKFLHFPPMLTLTPATQVHLVLDATDMRQGFSGLWGLAKTHAGSDPIAGHIFVFCNRTRTRIKILYWDGSGLWVCSKRLDTGRFSWPVAAGCAHLLLRHEALMALLGGLDVANAKPRRNWTRK